MNRILFQLGLLGFFAGCVVFGLEGFSIFDSIGRAFIVFIAVICAGITVLGITSWIALASKRTVSPEHTGVMTPSVEKNKG